VPNTSKDLRVFLSLLVGR